MNEYGSRVCLVLCSPLTARDVERLGQCSIFSRIDYVVVEDGKFPERLAQCFATLGRAVHVLPRLSRDAISNVDVLCFADTRAHIQWSAIEAACAALDAHDDIDAVKCSRSGINAAIPLSSRFSLNSLLLKAASGYWRITDSEYGLIVVRANALPESVVDTIGSQACTVPLLCDLGLRQVHMLHLDIVDATGDLGVPRSDIKGAGTLIKLLLRRIAVQYLVLDVNLATIYLLLGTISLIGALCFGAFEWYRSSVTGVPRSAGTIMLALLPLLIGFQLILNAVLYDVQLASESVEPFALSRQPACETQQSIEERLQR